MEHNVHTYYIHVQISHVPDASKYIDVLLKQVSHNKLCKFIIMHWAEIWHLMVQT